MEFSCLRSLTAQTTVRCCVWLCAIVGCIPASSAGAQPSRTGIDPQLLEALARQGLTNAKCVHVPSKREEKTGFKTSAAGVSQGLERLARGYKGANDASRRGVGLLDTTLEVALVGIDVGTGGASVVLTSGVRWV